MRIIKIIAAILGLMILMQLLLVTGAVALEKYWTLTMLGII